MERMKYQVPLDPVAFFEFLMGLYCLAIIYYSVETRRLFLLPFILIYASGFFYVSILSFLESFVYSGKRGRGEIPEVELKKA
jgi:hypothetical protein